MFAESVLLEVEPEIELHPSHFGDVLKLLLRPQSEWKKECTLEKFQGKGPGGQKRNRVYSGVRLVHPNGFTVEAVTHREVQRNEQDAYRKITLEAAFDYAPYVERGLSMALPYFQKFQNNRINENNDFYAAFCCFSVAAITLDRGRTQLAAEHSGWSSSALIRQWGRDKRLWTEINKLRQKFGKGPFKR